MTSAVPQRRTCVFLLGYPRSGTTLLRALLGAHSDVLLANEPELVRAMHGAGFGVDDQLAPESRADFLGALSRVGSCRRHLERLPGEAIERFLSTPGSLTFREAYEALLPVPADAAVWGEKSLGNVFYVRDLHKLYPRALFVEIVRDPRGAVLSYYRKKITSASERRPTVSGRAIRFFAYHAMQWTAWRDAVNRAEAAVPCAILRVRFEDLVAAPADELRRLCDALGIAFEPAMLDAAARRDDPVLRSSGAYAHSKLDGPIDVSRAHAVDDLPAWACYVVERHAQSEMTRLGYEPSSRTPGPLDRLRVELELTISGARIRSSLRRALDARELAATSGSGARSLPLTAH